jgi:glycosyltransferase involved in cell wall biosynthesis
MSAVLGRGTRGLVRALLPGVSPAATSSRRIGQLKKLEHLGGKEVWLLLTVIGGALPTSSEVETATREVRHNGVAAFVSKLAASRFRPSRWFAPRIDIVERPVLLDVHDSAHSRLMTGVQRVARSIANEWVDRDDVYLVGWSTRRTQLHPIMREKFTSRAHNGLFGRRAIVPWGGHYLLAESINEPERASRIQAIGSFAGLRSAMVGNDAIPLTTAETTGPGMPGVFAKYLAAASRLDVVACISAAAAGEYEGWRTMLSSAGLSGPKIAVVPLPSDAGAAPVDVEAEARELLTTPGIPMVLVIGSHEPRKNHLAVLHASEVLWREGHTFSLVFIGGNAWNSEEFTFALSELRAAGRPVATYSGLPEPILWWAYKLAAFTVFPSLNEGFGLPVAESLASGVPVVTSNFGSMSELADNGGCVLVDPRDDASIASGMRSLLSDSGKLATLTAEATGRPQRTWAEYADDLWRLVIN